ncbi:MAG: FAD-dependent oxidoreductase [Clostridia bacterium]|nr:FAD-dependent oxidoreductase [Clostridia bacterium]
MEKINFSRDIDIRYKTEILVCGGGPSGIAAAVTAARQEKDVTIVDMNFSLGGAGTVGMVPAFMQFSDGENFLADGIGREILNRLEKAGGTGGFRKNAINTEVLKRVYDDMVTEAEIKTILGVSIIGVEKDKNNISHVILSGKSGIYAIESKIFIDCTGDGDVCAKAGAPFEYGDENGEVMPGTLCSFWTDIEWDKVDGRQDRMLKEAFKEDIFTTHDLHLTGISRSGKTFGGGNIGHAFGINPLDEVSLTNAFIEQRKILLEYQEYYRRFLNGFSKVNLAGTASIMGIRESRRIMGDYVLCLKDFQNRAIFDDEIGRYCYPVDIHASNPDEEGFKKFEEEYKKNFKYNKGESYGIPYRILLPKTLDNVLMAGRCISCDRYLMGSIRVMPGCYITGQAAGMASSMAIEENITPREINVKKLQKKLIEIGAYLPNYKGEK